MPFLSKGVSFKRNCGAVSVESTDKKICINWVDNVDWPP